MSNDAYVGHVETKALENLLHTNISNITINFIYNQVPNEDNHVASILSNINPVLDNITLFK